MFSKSTSIISPSKTYKKFSCVKIRGKAWEKNSDFVHREKEQVIFRHTKTFANVIKRDARVFHDEKLFEYWLRFLTYSSEISYEYGNLCAQSTVINYNL